ncbi:MAG: ATP-dependent helicase HrpB, partial [Actinomycetota bacterium]
LPAILLLSPAPPRSADLIAPTDLPVEDAIFELRRALNEFGSAILIAPPGAGKTTLVPLRLLDEPWLADRRIIMLEPRRLAARAAARRISQLVGDEPGGLIGYQTRDERVIGPRTRIEIVTEGILTRRLHNDPSLAAYGLVIFDEVHERNLPTDLGLALCLDARRTFRDDMRVLAMSATADAEKFARVLGPSGTAAPIVRSEGRMFDVDIVWAPPPRQARLEDATSQTIVRALREHDGDVLVFLPGIAEIERTRRALADSALSATVDVWPLAGALSQDEQDRALSPSPQGRRRVVLSTDIAETSLTVDGIRIVVDAGRARIPQFDVRTGMTRLTTVAASRASCEQRSGRAGRVAPGVAYRLWSKLEHGTRRAHLDPEISQADLASFALDIALWGTRVDDLPFLQPPPPAAYAQARELLERLGALGSDGQITDLGRSMLELPVHPRLAKMIAASEPRDRPLACLLAALIDERDVLRGSPDQRPVDLLVRVAVAAEPGSTASGFKSSETQMADVSVDTGAIRRLRTRTEDLARRSRVEMNWNDIDQDRAAALLLFAYPDRVAIRRQPGQFQTVSGTSAWIPRTDPLADEEFVVAADLDGNRKSSRIRTGLAVHEHDLYASMGDAIQQDRIVKWNKERGDIVEYTTVRIGNMRIREHLTRPLPGEETSHAIFEHLAQRRFSGLLDADPVRHLTARVEFLRRTFGEDEHATPRTSENEWPDWSQKGLIETADEWLEPYLAGMTSLSDVEALNLETVLRSQLPWALGSQLDELAPSHLTLASGRTAPIDYSTALRDDTQPIVDVRVQDVFGMRTHPTIAGGRVPLVLRLLSPADRPIQVTADLPGFWAGSWADVRKDLAGRYPKHQWPIDPASAEPKRMKDR